MEFQFPETEFQDESGSDSEDETSVGVKVKKVTDDFMSEDENVYLVEF
jgi:hypothetical protein